MQQQFGKDKDVIANAWHGIIEGWHLFKAPRHDLFE